MIKVYILLVLEGEIKAKYQDFIRLCDAIHYTALQYNGPYINIIFRNEQDWINAYPILHKTYAFCGIQASECFVPAHELSATQS